jgi:hypothetical protein
MYWPKPLLILGHKQVLKAFAGYTVGALTEHSKTPNDANPQLKLTPAEGHRLTEMSRNTNWSAWDSGAFQPASLSSVRLHSIKLVRGRPYAAIFRVGHMLSNSSILRFGDRAQFRTFVSSSGQEFSEIWLTPCNSCAYTNYAIKMYCIYEVLVELSVLCCATAGTTESSKAVGQKQALYHHLQFCAQYQNPAIKQGNIQPHLHCIQTDNWWRSNPDWKR